MTVQIARTRKALFLQVNYFGVLAFYARLVAVKRDGNDLLLSPFINYLDCSFIL
jgi:hypothetical protein